MIMSVLRKLIVIILLIVIIFSLQFFQTSNIINAETLISLGFILLAGFSFGELTNLIGLTRIPGYLISGIVFGPYSDVIFQTHHLNIFFGYSNKRFEIGKNSCYKFNRISHW